MRMWNVDPSKMCRKHLLGEHVELHMFLGSIKKGTSMVGYIEGGLLEPFHLWDRHDAIIEEMRLRGYDHQSPLVPTLLPQNIPHGFVDVQANEQELHRRCTECKF